ASPAESWPSGRRRLIRNQVYRQRYQGFKSLALRQVEPSDPGPGAHAPGRPPRGATLRGSGRGHELASGPGPAALGRGDRVVEGARLEIVCARNGTEGSNPSLSASRSSVSD